MNPYRRLGVPAHARPEQIEAALACARAAFLQTARPTWLQRWRWARQQRAYAVLCPRAGHARHGTPVPLAEMLGRCPPGLM